MACLVNCKQPIDKIKPYGDIAGIGVLLSFSLTAFLLVVLVICYYLTIYDPGLDPFRPRDRRHLQCEIPNPFDRLFLGLVRRPMRKLSSALQRLGVYNYLTRHSAEDALNKSAKTFSDIQIFTGLAILISAFNTYDCDIQSYHWQLIIYMAWLATVTHASLLSFLRNDLLNHRWQLYWRFGGMFAVMAMLIVGIGLTPEFTWEGSEPPVQYIKCYEGEDNMAWALLESKLKISFFLLFGYMVRVMKLFRWFNDGPRRLALKLRRKSLQLHGMPVKDSLTGKFIFVVVRPVAISFLRIVHLNLDMWTSFLGEVFWLIVSFIWGTKRILILRLSSGHEDEDEWTFGQIVPLILLAAPIAALIDHFSQDEEPRGTHVVPTPAETSDAVIDPEIDEDYEQSSSLRGTFVLASIMYVHIAVYVLVYDSQSLISTAIYLVLSFCVFHPVAQATWIIYDMWVPMLGLNRHRTNSALGIIFSSLAAIAVSHIHSNLTEAGVNMAGLDLAPTELVGPEYRASIEPPALAMYLLVPYLVCAPSIVLAYELVGSDSQQTRAPYCEPCRVAMLASIVALALTLVSSQIWFSGYFLFFPVVFGPLFVCQLLIQYIEFGIEHKKWPLDTLLRGCVLACNIVCLIFFTFWMSIIGTFITAVSTCLKWVFLRAAWDTIRHRSKATAAAPLT